ncbi:MAG: hypothetical protein WEA09_00985 [Gemmatimonadota bacterium]
MPVPSSGVSPREFEEVGLAERHVRTALAQVRGKAPSPGRLDRVFGAAQARAARVVPHSRGELVRMLDTFFVWRCDWRM